MKKYYHNTTPENQLNVRIGFLSNDGDFITKDDLDNDKYNELGIYPVVELIVESGLLSCTYNYDQFCIKLAEKASRELGISPTQQEL